MPLYFDGIAVAIQLFVFIQTPQGNHLTTCALDKPQEVSNFRLMSTLEANLDLWQLQMGNALDILKRF